MRILMVGLLGVSLSSGQEVSGDRIRAHLKFLASDLLEGRGVGVRGGEIATEYIASQFAIAGARPAGSNGSWYQPVQLVGVTSDPNSRLSAQINGQTIDFAWNSDFVGHTMRQVAAGSVDAEAIFVGHGITAPEFDWDDYRGVDVKGKVVILFTNEPPSDDPKFFGGPALTYYGRWTYKYEEALRKGAAACLIIHTTPTATYNWEVVRNSWGREDFQVKLSAPALSFAGWLTQDAASKLLALAGYSVDDLLLKANTRGFQPIPLGVRVRASIGSVTRELATRNVAALVRGGDPAVNSELVVYSAHWDHLGMNDLATGDKIYNGAVDNASGCAMLLEIARVWADLPAKPRRSALFLAVTAEESGLLGSAYYAANPLVPIEKTSLAINYDSIYPFGRTRDVVVDGAQRTTFWPQIQSIAARFGLTLAPDPHPERGHYFRSDHFSFAKAGIPAFSVNQGDTFVANEERSLARYKEHVEKNYHQPTDEYRDDWDMANLEYLANFGIAIGMDAANSPALVRWEKEKKAAAAKSNRRKK